MEGRPAFGPSPAQAATSFAPLRTFTILYGHATLRSIPAIIPQTLRAVVLQEMETVDGEVIHLFFAGHFQTLERFEVDAEDGIILSRLLALDRATRLRHIHMRGRWALGSASTDLSVVSSSLVEIVVDWPEFTPKKALEFVEERKGGR
jgi:hypothetical protein